MRWKLRTKIEATLAAALLIMIAINSVWSVNLSISNSTYNLPTYIQCSNGNIYDATFTGFLTGLYSMNATGGTITVPKSNLTLTKTINCPSNVKIIGAGKGLTIIFMAAATNKDMMDISSKTNIYIQGITFNQNNYSQTYHSAYSIIDMSGTTYNVTIDNCIFTHACPTGVVTAGTDTGYISVLYCDFIEREYVSGAGHWSGAIRFNEQHNRVIGCRFKNCYTSCIYMEHDTDPHTICGYNIITDNYMTGYVDIGVCVEGWGTSDHPKGGETVIANNVIEGLTGPGDYGAAYPRAISVINSCTVTGNVVNGSRSGICVVCDPDKYGFGVVIDGNTITNIGTKYGINIEYTEYCVVSDNTIKTGGGGSYGIQIYNSFNNSVTGNIVWGFPTGIREANNANYNLINDNIVNCTTDITHVGAQTVHVDNIGTVS